MSRRSVVYRRALSRDGSSEKWSAKIRQVSGLLKNSGFPRPLPRSGNFAVPNAWTVYDNDSDPMSQNI